MRTFCGSVLSLAILMAVPAAVAQVTSQSSGGLSDVAYSVLSAYLRTQLAGGNAWDDIRVGRPGSVLSPRTMRWKVPLTANDKQWMRRDLRGVRDETIASFEECADSSVPIAAQFSLPAPYQIASENEIESVAKLYARYPKTLGFVQFSCVGINAAQSQALFFVERLKCRCAVGKFVLMEKNVAGGWGFKAQLVRWIS